jgi:hypothetical protein
MRLIIIALSFLIIIFSFYIFFLKEYIAIDSCLDNGGKWDKNSSQCLKFVK